MVLSGCSSLDNLQGPKTHAYYSRPPNVTYILNQREMIPLGGHGCLVGETFSALYGWNIPLGHIVHVSSHNPVQDPKA